MPSRIAAKLVPIVVPMVQTAGRTAPVGARVTATLAMAGNLPANPRSHARRRAPTSRVPAAMTVVSAVSAPPPVIAVNAVARAANPAGAVPPRGSVAAAVAAAGGASRSTRPMAGASGR